MWKKASYALLWAAALLATASAQTAASNVLVTMSVQVDGSAKDLQLLRGETIEDAAASFVRNHGLLANSDAARVRAVVDQLSGMLRGRIAEMQEHDVKPEPPQPVVQLSMPLTINGATRELKKFEGESVETAVERFLYDGDFTATSMRELYPQIADIVLAKLEQLQPPHKELFAFTLTIDGREAITRHFENGDPMEEARETFRGVGITDAAYIEGLAPQIANEINRRIAELQATEQPPAVPAQPAVPTKELFSIPLTANDRPTVLIHYEGYTSRESAVRYLTDNGLANAENMERMLAQVVPIIDNRIAELAQEQAAATRAAAEQPPQRQPLVLLSISVGENQVPLEYFEGDSIERTVELFLTRIGMEEGPEFVQNAAQLAEAIRRQLPTTEPTATETQPQPQAREPFVQLPVTLGGRVFDLLYFEGEQPSTTANAFCVEKYEVIRTELGMQFDGEQLLECQTLLDKTLRNLITQKQKEQAEPVAPQPETVATQEPAAQQEPPKPRPRGEHLVSLDVEIQGRNVPLDVHQNDEPEEIARAFCDLHKIGHENVQPLVEAIKNQLARLQ